MEKTVLIKFEEIGAKDLLQTVNESNLIGEPGLSFDIQDAGVYRSPLDPAVMVALVAGGTSVLTALVNGLLRIAEKRFEGSAKISIQGSNGRRIEIPVNTSDARIAAFVECAKALDQPSIIVTRER